MQDLLTAANARIKDMERQLHLAKQENEDLRVNLKINKESLATLLAERGSMPQESALIRTINVISSENIKMQLQLERLR